MELFEFKEHFRLRQSPRVVCIASHRALGDLAALFGGWIKYRSQKEGVEYLGVWGARNARAMRRILRNKGVDVMLRHIRPVGIEIRIRSSQGTRPPRPQ